MKKRFQASRLLVLLFLAVVIGSCSSQPTAKAVTVEGKEFAFVVPQSIDAGLVTMTFSNTGKQAHEFPLFRLDQGKTMVDVRQVLRQPNAILPAWVTFVGGVQTIPGGTSASATMVFTPGLYALISLSRDPVDGKPDVTKGMIASFSVVGDAGKAKLPKPTFTAKLKDYAFELPKISHGIATLGVTDEGHAHEMRFVKLLPGRTAEDVKAFFSQSTPGQKPFEDAGGLGALSIGQAAQIHINLTPGDYVALCHLPGPAASQNHLDLGMITTFHVE